MQSRRVHRRRIFPPASRICQSSARLRSPVLGCKRLPCSKCPAAATVVNAGSGPAPIRRTGEPGSDRGQWPSPEPLRKRDCPGGTRLRPRSCLSACPGRAHRPRIDGDKAQLLDCKMQLFIYVFSRIRTLINILRFDRGGPTTHVRVESAGRESRGTGLMFCA